MALFTDGPASTVDEMALHDSSMMEIVNVENINVTAKLVLAQEEIGLELESIFQRAQTNYSAFVSPVPLDLAHLVVTTPIRLWTTFDALAMVYRDAYFSQLTDRYQGKWKEYQNLAQWARDKLVENGVGLVNDPMPQAATPSITLTAASESSGTFYVSVSFVNAAGQQGAASSATSVTTTDGYGLDILPLNVPQNATGWNLYVGTSPSALYLQNLSPSDPAADFVFLPSGALTSGATPGTGQIPDMVRTFPRVFQRG